MNSKFQIFSIVKNYFHTLSPLNITSITDMFMSTDKGKLKFKNLRAKLEKYLYQAALESQLKIVLFGAKLYCKNTS